MGAWRARLAWSFVGAFSRQLIDRSGYDAEGFARLYDRHRHRPPPVVLSILTIHAGGGRRPALVVDLGCGTGLSTRAWSEHAGRVVGVEANPRMVAQARAATTADNVSFVQRLADDTGIEDATADIVTCSQAFHWMEPQPVLAEAARVLRPGGVFAAYDYDVVPVIEPRVDQSFAAHVEARKAARTRLGIEAGAATWPKHEHLRQLRESRRFRFVREVRCHAQGTIDAAGLVGLAHSIGGPLELFGDRAPEVALTMAELRATADRTLGDGRWPMLVGYTIRLGIT
jgi:SAM-dependent methyltransferase